jgi:hypothetical protein
MMGHDGSISQTVGNLFNQLIGRSVSRLIGLCF